MRTALSAIELTLLRCPIQWSRLYVAVLRPATLFSARLAAVPATWPAGTLSFNTGSPTSGTALAGNTVYIGSAADARDLGELRLRANLTLAATGSMSIAELGEQAFDLAINNDLTIVEDHRPAAKHIRYASDAWLIDYDIPYLITGTGNNVKPNEEYGPLARLGPPAIGFLADGVCTLRYVGERSAAYTPGKSISTYAWTFPNGNTSAAQGTTASPIEQPYLSALPGGRYHSLTVTESDTLKTHISYRPTWVFERSGANAPYDAAIVKAIQGSREQGGYRTTIAILNTAASLIDFPDKAQVVVFSEDRWRDEAGDYYRIFNATGAFTVGEEIKGSVSIATGLVVAEPATGYIQINGTAGEFIPGEIITGTDSGEKARLQCAGIGGNYPYRENIVLNGYVIDETVRQNPETGQIELEVATLDDQLRRCEGYPVALTNRSTTPVDLWEESKLTTLNTATHHFVKWRSTISEIADVEFAGTPVNDDVIIKYVTFDKMSLFEQINSFWNNTIFGRVACDFQGALYCEMDANIDETYRGNVVNGHTLTRVSDLIEEWEMPRAPIPVASQHVLLAVGYRLPMGSKSPGDPHLYEGMTQEVMAGVAGPLVGGDTDLLDQTTLNQWCGNLRARANNVYKNMLYRFAGNWRMDVIPQSWLTHNIVSGDTKRSIALTNKRFLPKELRLIYQERSMSLLSEIVADGETHGIAGVTYNLPTPSGPPPPPPPILPPIWVPPVVAGDAKEAWTLVDGADNMKLAWSGDFFAGGDPTWNAVDLPADLLSNTNLDFWLAIDGSAAYVVGTITGGHWICYRTATPKTPSWVAIAQGSQSLSGGFTIDDDGGIFEARMVDSTFVLKVAGASGITHRDFVGTTTDGVTWAWHNTSLDWGNVIDVSKSIYAAAINIHLTADDSHVGNYTYPGGTGKIQLWERAGVTTYVYMTRNAGNTQNVIRRSVSADLFTTEDAGSQIANFTVRGAYHGPYLYVIDETGKLYSAPDGATFTRIAQWSGRGTAYDAKLAGGGSIVWMQRSPGASGVPFRLYTQAGAVIQDMTGNFWSLFSGAPNLANLQLVF